MNYMVVMCCCHTLHPYKIEEEGYDAIISWHSFSPACTSPLYPPRNQPDPLLATNKSLAGRALATRAADREIDRIVYELYGLAAEEIAVVEGAG